MDSKTHEAIRAGNTKDEGLGVAGVVLLLILTVIISPIGMLIFAYFMFRGKEERKWKTAKIVFWLTLIPAVFISVSLILTSFLPYLVLEQ